MLTGWPGGNVGVAVGDDGIVLVDDQDAALAGEIQSALRIISEKPVRFVINTHHHSDHTGGNAVFRDHALIIAQTSVRKRLASGGICGNGTSTEAVWPPANIKALPDCTFDHAITLHLNGEDIRVLHFANMHTDGDAVVFFSKSKVVHMGDVFVTGINGCHGFPFVDIEGGGSVRGMIAGIEQLLPQIPNDAIIIPGHGQISTVQDVKNYLRMLKKTFATVEKAKTNGTTLKQLQQEKILDPWREWNGYYDADKYLETIYNDLNSAKPKDFIRLE
ncbi:MAG: MBL fold metallo-hydrolase [Verrucomicrobia bacterium]|nr:MBL fold metallo-hydrolase [Verrucomicrobiota bacterium]MBU1736435.1 MBL fold metallo-hydrolase [Verrucomicrobiota bacterium]